MGEKSIKLGEKNPHSKSKNKTIIKNKSNNSPLLLFLVEKIYSLLYTYAKGGLAMKLKVETKELETKNLIAIGQDKENGNTFCIIDPQTNLEMAFQLLHTLSLHILPKAWGWIPCQQKSMPKCERASNLRFMLFQAFYLQQYLLY